MGGRASAGRIAANCWVNVHRRRRQHRSPPPRCTAAKRCVLSERCTPPAAAADGRTRPDLHRLPVTRLGAAPPAEAQPLWRRGRGRGGASCVRRSARWASPAGPAIDGAAAAAKLLPRARVAARQQEVAHGRSYRLQGELPGRGSLVQLLGGCQGASEPQLVAGEGLGRERAEEVDREAWLGRPARAAPGLLQQRLPVVARHGRVPPA